MTTVQTILAQGSIDFFGFVYAFCVDLRKENEKQLSSTRIIQKQIGLTTREYGQIASGNISQGIHSFLESVQLKNVYKPASANLRM